MNTEKNHLLTEAATGLVSLSVNIIVEPPIKVWHHMQCEMIKKSCLVTSLESWLWCWFSLLYVGQLVFWSADRGQLMDKAVVRLACGSLSTCGSPQYSHAKKWITNTILGKTSHNSQIIQNQQGYGFVWHRMSHISHPQCT